MLHIITSLYISYVHYTNLNPTTKWWRQRWLKGVIVVIRWLNLILSVYGQDELYAALVMNMATLPFIPAINTYHTPSTHICPIRRTTRRGHLAHTTSSASHRRHDGAHTLHTHTLTHKTHTDTRITIINIRLPRATTSAARSNHKPHSEK